jgi:hypothetical protein
MYRVFISEILYNFKRFISQHNFYFLLLKVSRPLRSLRLTPHTTLDFERGITGNTLRLTSPLFPMVHALYTPT